MDIERDSNGRFQKGCSGNPRGRRPTSENIRKLLDPHKEDLIEKAISMAMEDNNISALKICLDRISPILKSESEMVTIPELNEAKSLTEKSEIILHALGNGDISLDGGIALIKAIAAHAKIIEIDELERRVLLLEGQTE